MKFHNLYIDCHKDSDYQSITKLLGVVPKEDKDASTWWYQLCQGEGELHIDFSKVFEALLKPKMGELRKLGLTSNDMLIWIVYEYFEQCSMSFDSLELQRLGNLKIPLNIDCYEVNKLAKNQILERIKE